MEKDIFKKMMGPPPLPPSSQASRKKRDNSLDCSPLSWEGYFDSSEDIPVPEVDATFRVYKSGVEKGKNGSLSFVLLHGAGHTALSWALCTTHMKEANCQIIAYDCRAHGHTKSTNEEDLSADVLTKDAIELTNLIFKDSKSKIIIVGHSMGGAIAAKAAASGKIHNLVGVVVVDVVEGTALAALSSMHSILEHRPQAFPSIEDAVQWSVSSGVLKHLESARLSIPSQLVEDKEKGKIVWRTNLAATEPFWEGWFTNLSSTFLAAKVAKVLILAGTDRLDKELMIAQMQGKFQLVLLPACGHTVQEDDPLKTANALLQFQQRNRW